MQFIQGGIKNINVVKISWINMSMMINNTPLFCLELKMLKHK